jgi:hypothetical protein
LYRYIESDGGDVFIDVSPALAAVQDPARHASNDHNKTKTKNNSADFQPTHQYHDNSHNHHHAPAQNTPAPAPPPPAPPPPPQGDHMALLSNWRGADVDLKGHKVGAVQVCVAELQNISATRCSMETDGLRLQFESS